MHMILVATNNVRKLHLFDLFELKFTIYILCSYNDRFLGCRFCKLKPKHVPKHVRGQS